MEERDKDVANILTDRFFKLVNLYYLYTGPSSARLHTVCVLYCLCFCVGRIIIRGLVSLL